MAISSGNDKFQSGIKRGKGKSWTTSSDLDSAADWLWKKVTSKKNRRCTYSSFLPSQLITEQRASSITGAIITCSIRTRKLEMSLYVYHHYRYSSTRQGHSSIGTHRTAPHRVQRIIGGNWKKETVHWLSIKPNTHILGTKRTSHVSLCSPGVLVYSANVVECEKVFTKTTLYPDCYCFRCRYTKDAGKSVIALAPPPPPAPICNCTWKVMTFDTADCAAAAAGKVRCSISFRNWFLVLCGGFRLISSAEHNG